MPFDSAFSSGQLDSLRGTSSVAKSFRAASFISTCPSNNVYTGRINQATINSPVPQFTYDGGSGTLASVRIGMRILFSHTSDRDDYYYSTVLRLAPTSDTMYINPAGALGFTDNDYFFVVNDYPVEAIYPRSINDVPVPGWDLSWRSLRPIIKDIPPVVVGYTTAATLSKAFAPTVQAAAADATISTYLWEVPSGVAFTSGSASTKDVTLAFNAGASYWIHFTATDSNGTPNTFHIHVWAHNDSYLPELLASGSWEIEAAVPTEPQQGAGSGFNGRISAFDGADTLLDNTLVCIWQRAWYNNTETNIGSSGNVLFAGRFRDEDNSASYDDLTGQQDAAVSFSLDGALAQLVRRFPIIEVLDNAAPSNWNEVADLTMWRAIRLVADEYSTFTSVYPLGFSSIADTYRVPGRKAQGGDLLNCMADFALQTNAVIQANALGQVEVARRGIMLDSADRSSLPTIADFDKRDYRRILSLNRDYVQQIGTLIGDGGGYNTTTLFSTAYDVQAPAGQPGQGAGDGQLPRQVLESDQSVADERTELETRAGHGYAAQQTPMVLRVVMADGYHGLTPAVNQWYTWTIAADETVRGRVYTTAIRWWLRSIRISGNPETGEIEAECEFVQETSGTPGMIIDYPVLDFGEFPNIGDLVDPIDLPPTEDTDESLPGLPISETCVNGQNVINYSQSLGGLKTVKKVVINYTASANIAVSVNKVMFRNEFTSFTTRGTFSTIAGTQTVEFNFNGSVTAEYIGVELYGDFAACTETVTLNSVVVTFVENGDWTEIFDFTAAAGGWTPGLYNQPFSGAGAVWAGGTGWQDADSPGSPSYRQVLIRRAFDERVLTSVDVTIDMTRGAHPGQANDQLHFNADITPIAQHDASSDGVQSFGWTGETPVNKVDMIIVVANTNGGALSGSGVVTQVVMSGKGTNPFRSEP